MCHHCIQHGGGGKWFLAAENFAANMYRRKKKDAQAKAAKVEKKVGEPLGKGKGDVDEYYHFSFLVSAFWIALTIAEVQTPNCLAASAMGISNSQLK